MRHASSTRSTAGSEDRTSHTCNDTNVTLWVMKRLTVSFRHTATAEKIKFDFSNFTHGVKPC